jgi:thiol-disulfide isomerase/thioredoxin
MSPVALRFRSLPRFPLLLPFLTLLLAGCASWDGSSSQTRQTAEASSPDPLPERAHAFRYPDEPPVLDVRELQAFVAKFRPRVVLLDFWASWSGQSRQEMPELARLQEELGTDSFQVISCNFDTAQQWRAETVPSLYTQQANFPCVVIRPDAKPALRAWLAPAWSYDLPARFILDSQGRVLGRALSDIPVGEVQDQARRLVMATDEGGGVAGLPADAVGLRIKLIDVRRGQAQTMSEVSAPTSDPRRLATQVCQQLGPEIDRRLNVRIAVLPFPSSRNRARAGTFGYETAEQVRLGLRQQGYYDLVGPEQTEKMIAASGLTALSIDYEPAVVKDRLNCDFLVLGWLRGEPRNDPATTDARSAGSPHEGPGQSVIVEHPEAQD